MVSALKAETMVVLGIALAAIYLAQKAGSAVVTAAQDALPFINPADNRNVVNQAANDLWQWATGSTQSIGEDAWDYMHKAQPMPGGAPGQLVNYTKEQQDADYKAMKQLEAGYHGM